MPARHLTASAIVLDTAGRVLLVHHVKSGLWLFPGGHVDASEDPASTAVRETREETGIAVTHVEHRRFTHSATTSHPVPFAVLEGRAADPVNGDHLHIDFNYVCGPAGGSLQAAAGEVHAVRWVPAAAMEDLHVPPELPGLTAAALGWMTGLPSCGTAPSSQR